MFPSRIKAKSMTTQSIDLYHAATILVTFLDPISWMLISIIQKCNQTISVFQLLVWLQLFGLERWTRLSPHDKGLYNTRWMHETIHIKPAYQIIIPYQSPLPKNKGTKLCCIKYQVLNSFLALFLQKLCLSKIRHISDGYPCNMLLQ